MSTEPVREQLLRLALSLTKRTTAHEIAWEERSNFGASEFLVDAGKYKVTVDHELSEEWDAFNMMIISHEGHQIASLSAIDGDNGFSILRELFETAMFSARGGEEAIDEIMTFLDQRAIAS